MVDVYVVSAFSKENKGGNKAGVVLNRPKLTAGQKMKIAKELGYSETAFLSDFDVADVKLEYFTPTEEVPLCGHATIATFSLLRILKQLKKADCTIETKAGILNISIKEDGLIFMEQNCPSYFEMLDVDEFGECVQAESIGRDLPVQIVSTGLRDIMLPVASPEQLESLDPDFEAIAELSKAKGVVGIHAFALNSDFDVDSDVTAVCRNFAPLYGIDEESATGTSSCALAGYLFRHYEKKPQYIFEQGHSMGETSRLVVNIAYHGDEIDSVSVGGYGYLVCQKSLAVS